MSELCKACDPQRDKRNPLQSEDTTVKVIITLIMHMVDQERSIRLDGVRSFKKPDEFSQYISAAGKGFTQKVFCLLHHIPGVIL